MEHSRLAILITADQIIHKIGKNKREGKMEVSPSFFDHREQEINLSMCFVSGVIHLK